MRLAEALEMLVRTDVGMLRSHNEDAVFVNPAAGLAILADGMGGYNAGEVASGMAISMLAESLGSLIAQPAAACTIDAESIEHCLLDEISAVNLSIFNAAESQAEYAGMGTTLVVACFYDNRMAVAHLGDSRLYRLRAGRLEQLTRDHSLLQEQLDSGMITPEEARYSHAMARGDVVLICSDGLNDMIEDDDIAQILHDAGNDLALAADELIRMANDNGGRDNVSVILVKVRGAYSSPRGWWQKLLARFQ